jgi:hypothetical protein
MAFAEMHTGISDLNNLQYLPVCIQFMISRTQQQLLPWW